MSKSPFQNRLNKISSAFDTISGRISKTSLILAAFAIITTGLVTLTHLATQDKIAIEQQNAIIQSINQILPKTQYDNAIAQDCIIAQDSNGQAIQIYRARLNQQPTALVIESIAPNGYSGKIQLLMAINTQQTILGVRTTQHQETPGLGDKIEIKKSSWITHFDGLKLTEKNKDRWTVIKEGGMFDAFTGATITPRAVAQSIKASLEWVAQQNDLFTQTANCGVTP